MDLSQLFGGFINHPGTQGFQNLSHPNMSRQDQDGQDRREVKEHDLEQGLINDINNHAFSRNIIIMGIQELSEKKVRFDNYLRQQDQNSSQNQNPSQNRTHTQRAVSQGYPNSGIVQMTFSDNGMTFSSSSIPIIPGNVGSIMGLFNPLLANAYINMFDAIHGRNMEAVPTPLEESELKQLKKCKFKQINDLDSKDDSNITCSICQENYEQESDVTILPCDDRHLFHSECIDNWLGKLSKKCPLCRTDLEDLMKHDDKKT